MIMQFFCHDKEIKGNERKISFVLEGEGCNIFYAKQPEISFGRNGKENMAENPFARRERSDFNTYYRAPWIFRQIFLVVKSKTDFRGLLLDGGFVCSTILPFG